MPSEAMLTLPQPQSSPKVTYIYFFAALNGASDIGIKRELEILKASVESLRLAVDNPEIILLTNSAFQVHCKSIRFSEIFVNDDITIANLDYCRILMQKRLIEEIHNLKGAINLCFIDHDTLVASDISCFFINDFDFGVTANFNHFELDSYGLPLNTGVATINAGVQLCKTSINCIDFLDQKISAALWAQENKNKIPTPLNPNPLAWGCDQISMMLLLNKSIYIQKRVLVTSNSTKIKVFSTNTLNYSPDPGSSVNLLEFYDHYIWHFKGNRKKFMLPFWEAFKNANTH